MNVGQFLARSARTHHDRVAVRFGELSWTYAELADRAARLAAGLLGLGHRAVIGWCCSSPTGPS